MHKNLLTFVNHACFHVSNEQTLLLVDPWVEGPVFNNGWTLLDASTSNAALVHELGERRLRTYIWFSHEHPDHFSIGFLRALRQASLGQVTVLFQKTMDRRVLTYLRRNGFDAIECEPGDTMRLDEQLRITVFPYADGDSYCLINSGRRSILNMNDCALTTPELCRMVRSNVAPLCSRIDVLLTQFGYANWIGNPFEVELRRRAAAEKRHRIHLQMEVLRPGVTIPFASFVSFSSDDNSYLNDCQNSAHAISQWSALSPVTQSVRFMKPGDVIDLEHDSAASLNTMSQAAVEHWSALASGTRDTLPPEAPASAAEIQSAFARYRKAVAANLPWLPYLLEKAGLIKPLVIYLPDLQLLARFSYASGYGELEPGAPYDISMTSASAVFLFSNDYGFNTTHVNGRFRTASPAALQRFSRFFMPQNLGRQGYGLAHPLATAGHLAGNILGRLRRA